MKLLISPTSPFARMARVVVLEKNLPCTMQMAVPWDDDPAVVENNPLRKIPVLLNDEVGALVDSRLICDYLDGLHGSPRLVPADAVGQWRTRKRVAIAHGALESALAIVMAGRVAPGMAGEAWKQWLMAKVGAALTYFESDADRAPAAAGGGEVDMGDVALGCLLGELDFRMPNYEWRGGREALEARWEKLSARRAFAETVPVMPKA